MSETASTPMPSLNESMASTPMPPSVRQGVSLHDGRQLLMTRGLREIQDKLQFRK